MADAPVTWTVQSSFPRSELQPGGNVVDGQRLQIMTNTGFTTFVFVPETLFSNTSAVRALIAGKVGSLAAIHNLSGNV